MKSFAANVWKENKRIILFVLLMLFFRGVIADWNVVPTGSMKPTIVEGDRIWVDRIAYDLKIPFTDISIKRIAEPKRGDIIVFDSKAADKRLVKRVMGLPGDIVEMKNEVLYINGVKAQYRILDRGPDYVTAMESILGVSHKVRIKNHPMPLDSFPPVRVPENHYLVFGDNRRESADSRVYGFVPRHELIGRSASVVMSLNYDHYYLPRADRFFKDL
jgi:signal peptidase I